MMRYMPIILYIYNLHQVYMYFDHINHCNQLANGPGFATWNSMVHFHADLDGNLCPVTEHNLLGVAVFGLSLWQNNTKNDGTSQFSMGKSTISMW